MACQALVPLPMPPSSFPCPRSPSHAPVPLPMPPHPGRKRPTLSLGGAKGSSNCLTLSQSWERVASLSEPGEGLRLSDPG